MPPSYSYSIRSSARSRTASEPAIFLSWRTNEEKRMDIAQFISGRTPTGGGNKNSLQQLKSVTPSEPGSAGESRDKTVGLAFESRTGRCRRLLHTFHYTNDATRMLVNHH